MASKQGGSEQVPIDSGTLLGIVSLIIAILSTLICVGQVIQQYVSTGSSLRLCDSIVYGGGNGLPGQGRRVWLWKQFRFRVLYDIPQLSLVPLSPSVGMFVPFLIKPSPSFDWPPPKHKLMSELSTFESENWVGEASWVAFSRVLLQACPGSVIINRVTGDADRCPSDMTNIPMPVSLRDLAILCLFVGMECTSASFINGTISMAGPVGTITSSQHPTLGSCVHYASPQDGFRLAKIGTKIDTAWILRACGRLRVANVVLIVGVTQEGPGPSGLRSPFDDPSDDVGTTPADSEKMFDLRHIPTSEMKTILLPSLNYYWMSQMSVVATFWATPFKTSSCIGLNTLWGALQVIHKVFIDLFYREGDCIIGYLRSVPNVLCGEDIVTYPPYGLRHNKPDERMSKVTLECFRSTHEYVESTEFDGSIPRVLIRKESMTPATHSRLDDHYNCTVEVMGIDVWLHITSRTMPIMAGRKQLLGKVPDMIQEVLSEYHQTFEKVALGSRIELEHASMGLRSTLQKIELAPAEMMYLLVALLRTVKVGLCIGLGNDSTPLLEIIEKDVQAHLL